MRGEEIVRRARELERERDGVRAKVRLPSALWARVRRCAAAVPSPAEEWVCAAVRAWERGKFDGVTYSDKEVLGTREGSETPWVRVPRGFDVREGDLRRALAAACAWHEPRLKSPTPQAGTETWVEGRDYILKEEG